MPRLIPRSAVVEAETKDWVRSLVRSEMSKRGLTFRDLAEMLTSEGLSENEGNLRSKVSRGELSGNLLLAALYLMKCKTVNVQDLPLGRDPDPEDRLVTIEVALTHPLVHVVQRDDGNGFYQVHIGQLTQPISVILERRGETGTVYRTSHYIYGGSDPAEAVFGRCYGFDNTPAKALQRAIKSLTDRYKGAVQAGRKPSIEWVRPCGTEA